jgi:hypothetical protein
VTTQPARTKRTEALEQVTDLALFEELFPGPVSQAVNELYIVDNDDREPPGIGKQPQTVATALQQALQSGTTLVEHSTVGGFVGIINGQLIVKTHLRLPVKKTLLFLASLVTLVGFLAPHVAHIQVTWR